MSDENTLPKIINRVLGTTAWRYDEFLAKLPIGLTIRRDSLTSLDVTDQTNTYTVYWDRNSHRVRCTCLEYTNRPKPCDHIFSVFHVLKTSNIQIGEEVTI